MRLLYVGLPLLLLAGALGGGLESRAESGPEIRMFRSATCSCCIRWARHLEREGFRVQVIDAPDMRTVKRELGIPGGLASCHTAQVQGYLVEGHVPAGDIRRLLRERPAVRGLSVPGMPEGSPGMEGPNPEPYTVWAFGGVEEAAPFAHHGPGSTGAPTAD